MAENCGQASGLIAARVRDPFFQATTQLQIISLISYAQQVVNGALSDVVQNAPLLLQPRTLIYQLSTFLPSAIKVLAVTDASGRDLDPIMEIAGLQQLEMKWPVAVADAPRGFVQVGADLLVIYPAVRSQQTLTVKYSRLTPQVANPPDSTVVPNEDDSAVNALTEALLLLKNRDLNAVAATMERFNGRIKELDEERR